MWSSNNQCFCVVQEIALLRRLSFDGNIVQFYGACLQLQNTMMVLEYMAVGTLHEHVAFHSLLPLLGGLTAVSSVCICVAQEHEVRRLHNWYMYCACITSGCTYEVSPCRVGI